MKKIQIIWIAALLLLFAACESDLLKTTIGEGTAPQLAVSADHIILQKADSANVALTVSWTDPGYLADTSNGKVIGTYLLEISKSNNFQKVKSYSLINTFEKSFSVFALNKLLLDLEFETEKSALAYIRVKSVFFQADTLVSNLQNISVTPYPTVIPPVIAVPKTLFITGTATPAGWNYPIPESQQLTPETKTTFTITIDLIASSEYALITDVTGSNWTPCYRLDPTVDREAVAYGGTFIWDGEGSEYGWTSVNFMSPPEDGTYKITIDFQDAIFTLVNVTGPPVIAVPDELWIYGDGLTGGWVTPFPSERQFNKIGNTKFAISIFIAAGTDYEMITDATGANWTPCYRIDPALDRNEMIWGGSFVWDGEGSDYSWGSKKFLSPPEDGIYKITMDFQTATFVVSPE